MKKLIFIFILISLSSYYLILDTKNVYTDEALGISITYPDYAQVFTEDNGRKIMFRDNEQGPSYVTVLVKDQKNRREIDINYWDGEEWIVKPASSLQTARGAVRLGI